MALKTDLIEVVVKALWKVAKMVQMLAEYKVVQMAQL
jgi:hypothetical protein